MKEQEIESSIELSKINFSEQELESFTKDFDEIKEFFKQLDSVDTEGVVAFMPEVEIEDLREDKAEKSMEREKVLFNAPNKDSISFIVPKVVE